MCFSVDLKIVLLDAQLLFSVVGARELIYLLTAIGLSPVAVHIYTQTIHRTIQNNNTYNNTTNSSETDKYLLYL